MAIIEEKDIIKSQLRNVAEQMLIAARTAPKGRGINNMEGVIIEGDDIIEISEKMKQIGADCGMAAFTRDAENILTSPIILLLGTRIAPLGLVKCGMCGFTNCAEKAKQPEVPCVFNTGDLGIAIGSAASIAMDHRIDNRIMYTVGQAAKELAIMNEDIKIIYAIPLSAGSKNIFFDRK